MICNAAIDIWQAESHHDNRLFKYEDDIHNLRFPNPAGFFCDGEFSYVHNRESSMALISDLHIPWHPEKTGSHFVPVSTFIGFEWNLPLHCVALPEKKRLKYFSRVFSMISDHENRQRSNLRCIQILHGTLVHVSFVFPDGSSRLPVFSNFMAGYHADNFVRHHLSDSFVKTLYWWLSRLADPSAYWQLHPISPLQDPHIYVDASTSWGIGIIVGEFWHAFPLVPHWKVMGHDICWLEAVALESVVYFLRQLHFSDTHIIIYSDNNGAIGAHTKHHSPNIPINLYVRRTYTILMEHLIWPKFIYIASELNPADPISHGESGASRSFLSWQFDMPRELQSFFLNDQ
jgi:hypothetical protein